MSMQKKKSDKKFYLVFLAITLVLAGIYFFINELLPMKAVLWIFAPAGLILYVSFFCFVFSKTTKKLSFYGYISLCAAIICSFPLLNHSTAYAFVDGSSFPFWKFNLSLGIICGIVFFVFLIKDNEKHIGRLILISVGVALLSALLISAYPANLNYMLDSNQPDEYTAIIEDKNMDVHRKSPTTYEFHLTIEGKKLDIEVGFLDYNKYDVGDTYTIKKYQGAFYVPFYSAK